MDFRKAFMAVILIILLAMSAIIVILAHPFIVELSVESAKYVCSYLGCD